MTQRRTLAVTIAAVVFAGPAAAQNTVDIFDTSTGTERLGTITLQEEAGGGVRFTPDLGDILPVGDHGFPRPRESRLRVGRPGRRRALRPGEHGRARGARRQRSPWRSATPHVRRRPRDDGGGRASIGPERPVRTRPGDSRRRRQLLGLAGAAGRWRRAAGVRRGARGGALNAAGRPRGADGVAARDRCACPSAWRARRGSGLISRGVGLAPPPRSLERADVGADPPPTPEPAQQPGDYGPRAGGRVVENGTSTTRRWTISKMDRGAPRAHRVRVKPPHRRNDCRGRARTTAAADGTPANTGDDHAFVPHDGGHRDRGRYAGRSGSGALRRPRRPPCPCGKRGQQVRRWLERRGGRAIHPP